jgi:hypothetical protein
MLALAVACLQSLALAGNQETAEQIATRLRESDQLRNFRVSVRFQGGTATLQGAMSSQGQIDEAVRIAGEVPGVRQVVSELEVASHTTKPPQATFADLPGTELGTSPQTSPEMNDKGTVKSPFSALRARPSSGAPRSPVCLTPNQWFAQPFARSPTAPPTD